MAAKDIIKGKEVFFLFLLIVFTALFRQQAANMPLDVNEGSYAYGAEQMSRGVVPYDGFFQHRPPVILYVYKAAFSFFGHTSEAVRNFATLYVTAVILAIYMLARVLWRSAFTAMLAAFFYVIYQHSLILQGLTANAAFFAQLPVILSMLFVLDRDKKYETVNFCASGFFAATALLTDLMAGLFVFVPLLYIIVFCHGRRVKGLLWFLAGYAAVLAAAVLWAFYNHIQYDILVSVIIYNFKALLKAGKGTGFGEFLLANMIPAVAFIYSGWHVFVRRGKTEAEKEANATNEKSGMNFMFFFTAFFLYAAIFMTKGGQPHYYAALMPVAAFLSAALVHDMYLFLNAEKDVRPYSWIILTMFLVLNTAAAANVNRIGMFMKTSFYAEPLYYEQRAMAQTIILSSQNKEIKNNFVFAWPDMPSVYFTVGVKPASRYAYTFPLEVFTDEMKKIMEDMTQERPSWLVIQRGSFGPYQAFLDNYYAKAAETKNLVLYRNILF